MACGAERAEQEAAIFYRLDQRRHRVLDGPGVSATHQNIDMKDTHKEVRVEEETEDVVRPADLDGGVEARDAVVAGVCGGEGGSARRVRARAAALGRKEYGIYRRTVSTMGAHAAVPCTHSLAASN